MKTCRQTNNGFTLVELLVVIAIIALLMGLLFPAIGTVKNAANKAKAGATIGQLCTASKAYNNEYGKWPEPRGNFDDLVYIFNGLRNPSTGQLSTDSTLEAQNPRKIQFMEFKTKDITTRSASSSTGAVSLGGIAMYDPWGTPYGYCFDNGKGSQAGRYCTGPTTSGQQGWRDTSPYDNVIEEPFTTGGTVSKISGGFAFFSNGPDTRTGAGPSNPSAGTSARQILAYEDDVRSWK